MTLESIKNLVAGNQLVEIYKNEFIHSENLIFKGSFDRFKNNLSGVLEKYKKRPIFQFIGAGQSLIIILRKGVI